MFNVLFIDNCQWHLPERIGKPTMFSNPNIDTHRDKPMRTNIVIDDRLIDEAFKATGLKTKKELIELGLKTLINLKQQEGIKAQKGKLAWEGNLA